MNLSFFIARRLTASDASRKSGVMERIAVISVALSIAVMILAMAVVRGFKREVSLRMTALSGDVVVGSVAGDADPIVRSGALDSLMRTPSGFHLAEPFALTEGIIRTEDEVEGVVLRGVEASYAAHFAQWIVEGDFPRIGGEVRTKDILIGRPLAKALRIGCGDRIEMLFVDSGGAPCRDRFKVSGIFSTGMDETDRAVALTDLRNVSRLTAMTPGEVTGYQVFIRDPNDADRYADALNDGLFRSESDSVVNIAAESIRAKFPNVFDWLSAHDVNSAVIIAIMLIVAFFNMAVVLLVLVLERTKMIGLLKVLGMRNGALRTIFLYRAGSVALRGMVWGNVLGVGMAWLQLTFHLVGLDSEGYLLSEVPIRLEWGWWLALNGGFIVAILVLLIVPATIVASIKPEETIKYE